MNEPKLLFCGVRDTLDENDFKEYHIECRFADGQKRAVVKVDGDFPDLAQKIAEFLNGSTGMPDKLGRQLFLQITNSRSGS